MISYSSYQIICTSFIKTPGRLTLRLLMSHIYMERIFLMFLDHTQRRTTVGRTPLNEWSARRTHPHITKPTHTHTYTLQNLHIHTPTYYKTHTYTHPHITEPTHTHTHTLQNPHIHTPTHTHTPTHYKAHTLQSLRPLPCWDRGFESHRGHGYLSAVSVVCCQVEVSATSWSLVQRSPTDCGASLCVI